MIYDGDAENFIAIHGHDDSCDSWFKLYIPKLTKFSKSNTFDHAFAVNLTNSL